MRAFLTAVVGLLACAAPASAGTVAVSFDSGHPEVVYIADPGQRNDVTATRPTDFALRVHDEGAKPTPGDGCKAIDERTVECESPREPKEPMERVNVFAGDMDDVVRSVGEPHPGLVGPMSLTSPDLTADGGPGDDVLIGGDRFDRLNGGGGHDTLLGMAESDRLDDGDTTGAADSDLLDGGRDDDTVTYANRTAPVTLDLGSDGPAGEAGEGDTIRAVEIAHGGSGDDRLTAGDPFDTITGGAGDDTLTSRGYGDYLSGNSGDDVLNGGPGRDTLSGGRGDDVLKGRADYDTLDARSGKDLVDCGGTETAGTELATPVNGVANDPGRADLLIGCDQVIFRVAPRGEIKFLPVPVARRGGILTLDMGCRSTDLVLKGCERTTGRLRVTESRGKRRTVARGVLHAGRDRNEGGAGPSRYRVPAHLTRFGRHLLSHHRQPRLTIVFTDPALPAIGWTVRVQNRRTR